jgi:hypothetical protein
VKKAILYTISLITCLYFFSSGNLSFFSKLAKNYRTELVDLDKDAADKSESEKSDSKEDFDGEENFISGSHLLITINSLLSTEVFFAETGFFISKPLLEINSPPPQA